MSNTQSRVRRARKNRLGCHRILAGELYIEHTEFPGGDAGYATAAGHPVRLAECRECAVRYGRGHLIDAFIADQHELADRFANRDRNRAALLDELANNLM